MSYRLIAIFALTTLILVACGQQELPVEKQLEQLRTERITLDAKIRDLEKKVKGKNSTQDAQSVTFTTTQLAPFNHVIDLKGTIESRSSVQVTPKTAGQLITLTVRNGDAVTKGQLLAQIDDELIRKGMDEVKVQLDFATTLYEKQKRIFEAKAGSEIQYLTAKNQMESLQRRMESLVEQSKLCKIVAPVSGYADMVMPKVGENVAPGYPIMTIVNLSDLRIVADVAESYISTVNTGDAVKIYLPEIGDTVQSRISVVSKNVNPMSRAFQVEIPVAGAKGNLRPNTTCGLMISDQTVPKTLAVPIESVLKDAEGQYVFVIDEKNAVSRRGISTGLSSGGSIQVTGGLSPNERVVVRGALDVADGQRVRPVQQ